MFAAGPNTAPKPSSETCYDRVGNGLSCTDLQQDGVCNDQIGSQLLCPLTCGTCTKPTTAGTYSI